MDALEEVRTATICAVTQNLRCVRLWDEFNTQRPSGHTDSITISSTPSEYSYGTAVSIYGTWP